MCVFKLRCNNAPRYAMLSKDMGNTMIRFF